jgi:hypothetical protein
MELYLPPIVLKKKDKRPPRPKINWTEEMLMILKNEFPVSFNADLAKKLGISKSTLNVKARNLGIKKEPGFLEKNRGKIVEMATEVLKKTPHPGRGVKGWCVPNSEHTRFRKGNISIMSLDPDVVERSRRSRMETVRREKIRIQLGLPQKTKLNLIARNAY